MRVSKGLSFEDEESFKEGVGSLNFCNPPSDLNTLALGSSGSIPLQERNKEICFNNLPSDDLNSVQFGDSEWEVAVNIYIPPKERIGVI